MCALLQMKTWRRPRDRRVGAADLDLDVSCLKDRSWKAREGLARPAQCQVGEHRPNPTARPVFAAAAVAGTADAVLFPMVRVAREVLVQLVCATAPEAKTAPTRRASLGVAVARWRPQGRRPPSGALRGGHFGRRRRDHDEISVERRLDDAETQLGAAMASEGMNPRESQAAARPLCPHAAAAARTMTAST